MNYHTIIYNKTDMICTITLDCPDSDNAISRQMAREITEACDTVISDPDIKVVIITGAGSKAFSCGTDPDELETTNTEPAKFLSVASAIRQLTCPVVAAINGNAIGQGLELALVCDIRIAVESARFGLPQIQSGRIPWDGGTQLLPRIIGKTKAAEMILSGETISSQEALEIGLISKIVPLNELMPVTKNLTNIMAAQSSLAMKHAKEAILKGLDMTLEQGLRLEGDLYFLLHTTEDRTEGIRAFLEKRLPQFKGK